MIIFTDGKGLHQNKAQPKLLEIQNWQEIIFVIRFKESRPSVIIDLLKFACFGLFRVFYF
jgi:hypothetical protein